MMAGYLPEDLQAEQSQIERQRMLAQLLQQNGQAPQGQMIGNRYVAPSWSQYLNSAVSNYRGQSNQAEADQKQKALAAALQGRKDQWLQSMPQAQPAREMGPPTEAGQMGQMPATAPTSADQMNWAMQGMQIDPEMTKTALALRQSMQKDNSPLTVKEGETLLNRDTMKPIFENPKSDSTPPMVKEFNFAKQNGYPGSFEQWVLSQKKAGRIATA